MKGMNLFLVGVVLLLGFAGFAYAEVNDTNDSFGNDTVVVLNGTNVSIVLNESNVSVVLNESNVSVVLNETNETTLNETNETLLDENQTEQVDLIIDEEFAEDLIIEEEVIIYKKSVSDKVVSYVSGVVNRINEVHENLFLVIIIILGVVLLFVYSVFFNYSSAKVCFAKASSLHRRGEIAHVNGDYAKAKKLYSKSYLFRERGEGKVSGGADGNAI